MRKFLIFILIIGIPLFTSSQPLNSVKGYNYLSSNDAKYLSGEAKESLSKFSLSFNPLGFVQFGPIINAEYAVSNHFMLNLHTRITPLGVLAYVVREDDGIPDKLSGLGWGGGAFYFFGEKRNRPYFGFLLEYEKTDALYSEGEDYEWSEIDKSVVFLFNGGYRFNFNKVYINTGAFLGAVTTQWVWRYTDFSYESGDDAYGEGTSLNPLGMLEVTFGLKF